MKFVLIAVISSAAWMHAAASGNLLSCETDFETTTEGWYGWNPCVPEPNCAEDGAVGSRSLEFRGSESLRSPFIWDALKPETHYTVSFFAKGDGGRLSVALVTTGWRWIGAHTVGLDSKWRRISYTFKTGASGVLGRAFCVEIKRVQSGSYFRIDGLKIEEGKTATPYEPRPVQFSAALEEPGEIHLTSDGPPVMKIRAVVSAPSASNAEFTAEVVNERDEVVSAAALVDGKAEISMDAASGTGYYPWLTRLKSRSGAVLASRQTPFVVTRPSDGNDFFGVQQSSGVPIEALRRAGFRRLRRNTKFWKHEESEGPRPLTGREKVQSRSPVDMQVLATAWGDSAPKWALGPGRTMWTDDVNLATNYLANLVFTTTNAVDCYEIINEPDLVLPREKGVTLSQACDYYAKIVKLTADFLRPTRIPVAIDVSGVREGTALVEHVLKTSPESVDIVAAHPYSWPRELSEDGRTVADPETGGFINDLNVKTALLKKYGKSRMAIGELGWALDMRSQYASASAAKMGWYLSRMYLLARTYPAVEYLIWYCLANAPENGTFDYGLWRSNPVDGTRPLPAVAAVCEAVRRLPAPGKSAVVPIRSGEGLYVLSWADGKTVHYAYWTDEPLDEPLSGLEVFPHGAFDFSGRKIELSKLTLSGAPVYLEVAAGAAGAFEASFLQAASRAYSKRPALLREEVRVKRFTGDWKSVDFTRDDACFSLGGKRADVMPPDPTVQWTGEDDLSARVLLGWDEENFYFFAAVKDDVHATPKKGYDSYMNDLVQMAFDPKDNAKKNAGYLPDDCEFGLCGGAPLFSWRRPGVAGPGPVEGDFARVVRTGGVTEYRAAVPWRVMGLDRAPKACGFAFAVCDNDDNERARYWLAFGNGIADGKRPARFKHAVFTDDSITDNGR